jgi:RIO kinase 1
MPGKHGSGLSQANFTRGFLSAAEQATLMETFGADGSIRDVLGVIGDGKEATVYACRAGPDTGVERAVAKVYRARKFRAFANASAYEAGQIIGDARMARAIQGKTRKGRLIAHHLWIEREWETLCRLFDAGADVPEPYTHSSDAILMEYVGTDAAVAPLLRRVRLSRNQAETALQTLLSNVEIFLTCDRIHGDLSAYNVLYDRGRVCVIDFPQAIDARRNPNALELLRRDVMNLCRYFERLGIRTDAVGFAHDLWTRYTRGRL